MGGRTQTNLTELQLNVSVKKGNAELRKSIKKEQKERDVLHLKQKTIFLTVYCIWWNRKRWNVANMENSDILFVW